MFYDSPTHPTFTTPTGTWSYGDFLANHTETVLVPGNSLNQKMIAISNGKNKITSLQIANALPTGFTPTTNNTVSTRDSRYPVYIFYEENNGTNTIYFYSESNNIYMNSNSSSAFGSTSISSPGFTALNDISALANFNTSFVTTMSSMFLGDTALNNLSPLSNWNTENVTNMNAMFQDNHALTDISPLSNWDTSCVSDMGDLFAFDPAIRNPSPINNWDISTAVIKDSYNENIDTMFSETYSKPNFIKYPGTWNQAGTFVPTPHQTSRVRVNMDNHIKEIKFIPYNNGTQVGIPQVINTNNDYIIIDKTYDYTISAKFDNGYVLNNWSVSGGTVSNATSNPTSLSISANSATLTATSTQTYTVEVTVAIDGGVSGIDFTSDYYDTQTVTFSNSTITLVRGQHYYLIGKYNYGYTAEYWEDSFSVIGDEANLQYDAPYAVSQNITLTSKQKHGSSTLIDGSSFYPILLGLVSNNAKQIKSIQMTEHLPDDFSPSSSNTVSDANSSYPIYAYYDNTNENGIIYLYTEAKDIYAHAQSSGIFSSMTALSDISALTHWNTSNVTEINSLFIGDSAISNLSPLSNWDTSSIREMYGVFSGNSALTNLDALAAWDTSSVTHMSSLFENTTGLTNPYAINNWDIRRATGMYDEEISPIYYMFNNAPAYPNFTTPTGTWDSIGSFTANTTETILQPGYEIQQKIVDLANGKRIHAVKTASNLPNGFTPTTDNTVSNSSSAYPIYIYLEENGDTNTVYFYSEDNTIYMNNLMDNLFANQDDITFASLSDISALADWNASSATSMSGIFDSNLALTDLSPLANWDTSHVTDMAYLFGDNLSLTDLSPLANWDTHNVENLYGIFFSDVAINNYSAIDNWDIRAAIGMRESNLSPIENMFVNNTHHSNFNKYPGTWDDGTFTPTSNEVGKVTINMGDHVKRIVFDSDEYGKQTINTNNDYIILDRTVTYTVTAVTDDGYELDSWDSSDDSLSNNYQNEVNYYVNSLDAILTATAKASSAITVNVTLDTGVSSVSFINSYYDTQTITSSTTINLIPNQNYEIISKYSYGYTFSHWSTSAGGYSSYNSPNTIYYAPSSNDSITLSTTSKQGSTTLLDGFDFHQKLFNIADTAWYRIKSLQMTEYLPYDFTPSADNTVSTGESTYPVYIYLDDTDGAGIVYFYTKAKDIYTNDDSTYLISDLQALSDISALASWNTSRTTMMDGMFYNDRAISNLSPLANWDTGNATFMTSMFNETTGLSDPSAINNWNINNVSANGGFDQMFYNSPSHPNFTRRSGTWNDGTFIPS